MKWPTEKSIGEWIDGLSFVRLFFLLLLIGWKKIDKRGGARGDRFLNKTQCRVDFAYHLYLFSPSPVASCLSVQSVPVKINQLQSPLSQSSSSLSMSSSKVPVSSTLPCYQFSMPRIGQYRCIDWRFFCLISGKEVWSWGIWLYNLFRFKCWTSGSGVMTDRIVWWRCG